MPSLNPISIFLNTSPKGALQLSSPCRRSKLGPLLLYFKVVLLITLKVFQCTVSSTFCISFTHVEKNWWELLILFSNFLLNFCFCFGKVFLTSKFCKRKVLIIKFLANINIIKSKERLQSEINDVQVSSEQLWFQADF